MVNAICILQNIEKLLTILVDKTERRANTHAFYTFSTAGTETKTKDISQLLGLPKQYVANEMVIFDVGGGFTFKLNGQDPALDAVNNLSISNEDINNVDFTSGGVAGTAKIRFSAYIPKV